MGATQGEHERYLEGPLRDGIPSLVAAAHELKSPLALIRQLSLSLEDGIFNIEEQQRMLRQISLTSECALRLTSDLTRSVRLSEALFTLEPINPQQLCEDIVHELAPFFIAHDCKVKLKSRKHPLLLIANRDLLRRIIMNFSDNALHYTEENTTVEIQIKSRDKGRVVRLGVRDYGPALSNNVLGSLKGKLLDASTTVHARPQSSGLGLYIAGQFADAMNGNIGVERHRNGSTFYVDLQASNQLSLL
ncbi:MAG: HAMP domain-containing sensor histidine kinase [Candidatus Saccharibacteria bacterium]|nr:HAMP domain-containing sensor histidine kinase [Candidatus Saccharibacteria bacterium]